LLIKKPFTIKGAGEGKTIIDGCQAGSVIIVGKNRSDIDVTLSGMTIMGGTGTSVSIDDHDANTCICGGGIFNYGRLTITDSIISGNTAYYGGGVFNKGTVNLEEGTSVTNNSAHNGGGIYGNRGLINLNGGTWRVTRQSNSVAVFL
jgi:predicted outer membrane repeat protein